MRIIDFHTHIGKINCAYYRHSAQAKVEKELGDLLISMEQNAINSAVSFPQPMLPHTQHDENMKFLNTVKYEKKILPFVLIDPRLDEASNIIKENRSIIKGVKMHPVVHGYLVDHPLCGQTLEIIHRACLPLIIHSGWGPFGKIANIAAVAEAYPKMKIIIAHMVGDDIVPFMIKHENLFVETSYAVHPRKIKEISDAVGVERVLFGTDWPYGMQNFEKIKLEMSGLTENELEQIFFRNACKILNIKI